MARFKSRPIDYVLVVGYVVTAIFLYTSVAFPIAAVADFLLMLLVAGLIALTHRKELTQNRVWDSIRAERHFYESGSEQSESKPKPPLSP
jgi:hypothetical protein